MTTNQAIMTGPNTRPTAAAAALNGKQDHDDRRGDRHDPFGERRLDDFESLHRRQHRDRRCDHAVAEEQGRSEDAQHGEPDRDPAPTRDGEPTQQRDQRHDAALTVVVGTHGQQHVGDHHDDHYGPEDQGHHAEHVV
jgi:hypothetical protein